MININFLMQLFKWNWTFKIWFLEKLYWNFQKYRTTYTQVVNCLMLLDIPQPPCLNVANKRQTRKQMSVAIRTRHVIIQESIAFICHCRGKKKHMLIICVFLYISALLPNFLPAPPALPILDESRGVPRKLPRHLNIDFCYADIGQKLYKVFLRS